MANIFGKKKSDTLPANMPDRLPKGSGGNGAGSGGGGVFRPQRELPWEGQPDCAACNFACVHLIQNLQHRLTVKGYLHANSLLTASGAIAGYAVQRAVIAEAKRSGETGTQDQFKCVQTTDGNRYIFGEPLNQMLISATDAEGRLWPLAAGAAVTAGLPLDRLPKVEDMFAHVSRSIGTELDGLPSVPQEHHPHLPARDLLRLVWPLAEICFTGRLPDSPHGFGVADVRSWPAIAAIAANKLIVQLKDVLDPAIALVIVVEAGIYASKLAPESVEQPGSLNSA